MLQCKITLNSEAQSSLDQRLALVHRPTTQNVKELNAKFPQPNFQKKYLKLLMIIYKLEISAEF